MYYIPIVHGSSLSNTSVSILHYLRLRDARGGDITLRPGVVSEAPFIRAHPTDMAVQEGKWVEFKVLAGVSARMILHTLASDLIPLVIAHVRHEFGRFGCLCVKATTCNPLDF